MNSTALWYATVTGLTALVLLTLTMVLGITTTTHATRPQLARLRPDENCTAGFP